MQADFFLTLLQLQNFSSYSVNQVQLAGRCEQDAVRWLRRYPLYVR
jgi:hypothetical protein